MRATPVCRFHQLLAATLVALAITGGVQAQDAAKGASLLAEAKKAVGGEDKLRAVKALDMKGDFKRAGGQNTVEGELEIRLELPDKLRRDEDTSLPGGGPAIVRTEVLNGTQVWDENSGGGGFGRVGFGGFGRGGGFGGGRGGGDRGGRGGDAQIERGGDQQAGRGGDPAQFAQQLEDAQRRARQADLARLKLILLLATDAPVNWVGTAEAPDGKADVLEITPAGGTPTRLFLEQTSHLPLMITWSGPVPQAGGRRGGGRGRGGEPITLQMTLAEYKTVNGIKLPHLITRGTSDQTVEEWTVSSYRINPSFKSNVFNK